MGYFFEPTAFYAYDAVWALAFALNRWQVEQHLTTTTKWVLLYLYRSLDAIAQSNFSYATGRNTSLYIQNELKKTTFNGVSVSLFIFWAGKTA